MFLGHWGPGLLFVKLQGLTLVTSIEISGKDSGAITLAGFTETAASAFTQALWLTN